MNYTKNWAPVALIVGGVLILPALAAPRHGGDARGGPPGQSRGPGQGQGLAGTVSAVDATAGTLSVLTDSGSTVTLLVPSTMTPVKYTATDVSGLKAGDSIVVTGVPLSIQAKAIQASGLASDAVPSTTTGGTATSGTTGGIDALHPAATATARGTVQSVDAANNATVVTLADGTTVTVTVPAGLQVSRRDAATLADVAAGDRVRARVSVDSAGNVTAVSLEVQAASTSTTGTTTGG